MHLPLRKLLFWLHLSAALIAGVVILLMAGTGLLLAFEAQIAGWADGESRRVAPVAASASSGPASLESLLSVVAAERGELAVTAVTLKRDPSEAVVLALGRAGVIYVDPYRRQIVGNGAPRVASFFRGVTDLHRYLAAAGDRRPLGKSVTGAANLVFLFILLSGLYLWVPRVFGRAQFRNVVWFRRQLGAKARDLNWHHVLGVWALIPLILIVASATPMSYRWAGDLVLRITGSPAPADNGRAATPSRSPAPPATVTLAEMDLTGLDLAVASAAAESTSWRSLTVRLPVSPEGKVSITVDRAARRGRPDLRTPLVLDRATGRVIERELFTDLSLGRRVRSWMRWIHTGEAGGLAGQTVGAVACAATLVLGWTGFALAWRRLTAWRRRSALQSASTIPDRAVTTQRG